MICLANLLVNGSFGYETKAVLESNFQQYKEMKSKGEILYKRRVDKRKGERVRRRILPGKLTCPLKINGWKMYLILK